MLLTSFFKVVMQGTVKEGKLMSDAVLSCEVVNQSITQPFIVSDRLGKTYQVSTVGKHVKTL